MFRKLDSSNDWREKVQRLDEAAKELATYSGDMSAYERNSIAKEIADKRAQWGPIIIRDALNEFESRATRYKTASEKVQKAHIAEESAWDAAKLNSEIQLLKTRVDLELQRPSDPMHKEPDLSVRLERIYRESIAGDKNRARAAMEVMQSVSEKVPEPDRMGANRLARKAAEDLANIRYTKEIREAEVDRDTAAREVIGFQEEIFQAGMAVDGIAPSPILTTNDLGHALRRISRDEEGHLVILDKDDPEVSGVIMFHENKMAGGQ